MYALKFIEKKNCIETTMFRQTVNERSMLQTLDNHYIIKLKYAWQDDFYLFMGLEYAPGGDLSGMFNNLDGIDEGTMMLYAAELTHALAYLHENNIVHRYVFL